ncbi:Mitochondrial import inner membrane translocase subunit Tim9 [Platanthera guangdongensis]|uniref:Mitochondrial import inner membrane translocase subunit n=1 Tax=Platanthera guangdongensis TaxID=2320717 RepID=A0ABR2MXK7_9ASPA
MSVAELKERHVTTTETVNALREWLTQMLMRKAAAQNEIAREPSDVADEEDDDDFMVEIEGLLGDYKNLSFERCFDDCVDSFKRKTLNKQGEMCVRRCAEKFLKHSMRVGMRFAELNQGAAIQD